MALGRAYIEVHADTGPFARDLANQIDEIIRASGDRVRRSSRRLGDDIGDGIGDGLRRRRRRIQDDTDDTAGGAGESFGRKLLKGIIDTLDDGLSGLPAEIKAGLAGVLVATAPFAIALGVALATAILAGLALGGLTLIGVKFASQFEEVQDRFTDLKNNLRRTALEGAESLVRPFINALNEVGRRVTAMDAQITDIFASASRAIVPITDAVLGFVEELLPGLQSAFGGLDKFFAPLQVGLRQIGAALGDFFSTLLNNDDSTDAFYDLLVAVEDGIQLITFLTDHALNLYGVLRQIITLGGLIPAQDLSDIKELTYQYGVAGEEVGYFGEALKGTVAPTEEETEAIEQLNQQIALLTKLTVAQVSNQIAYQQGLDDLTESVKKNHDTVKLGSQAGRDNAKVLLDLAETILKTRDDTIQLTGDVDRANAKFRAQTKQVYELARQLGLSKGEVDSIIGALLKIPAPKQSGITASSLSRLEAFNQALRENIYLQSLIDPTYNPRGPGGQQRYAEGGIVTGPTNALIGEAGPEAVIPLSKPARAAEIMNEAGLSSMLSPSINVFIGNQQIDAYIDARVNANNAVTARSLAYGSRSN